MKVGNYDEKRVVDLELVVDFVIDHMVDVVVFADTDDQEGIDRTIVLSG